MNICEYLVGLHLSGVANTPVQQVSGELNTKHALLHAITLPSVPFIASSGGHIAFKFPGQLGALHPAPP